MNDEIQNIEREDAQPEDAQLEAMMRTHLKSAIDPHIGSAARRFTEHLEGSRESRPRFRPAWSIGLIGAAIAATFTIFSMRHVTPPPTHIQPSPVIAATLTGSADFAFHMVDQGIVHLSDGSLARKYHQQRMETITVVDPQTNQQTIYKQPRDETILVGLKQY